MAITKSSATLLNAVTTTQTSSAQSISSDYVVEAVVSIAQVGTASTAATIKLQWSVDGGTTYFDSPVYSADTAAATYYWTLAVPVTATHVKAAFTQQSGGTSSTCTVHVGQVTAI